MIAQLTGIVLESNFTRVVLDVNGVGYEVSIPLSTFEKLPQPGGRASLFTHLNVREDALQLYGFATRAERALFQLLTSAVSGIGPKIALNILSAIAIDQFLASISAGDVKALSKINGIGKKTAERIIVELKDKLAALNAIDASLAAAASHIGIGEGATGLAAGKALPQQASDTISALETLGFKHEAAESAVAQVLAQETKDGATVPSTEQLLRKALSRLNS